MKPENTGLRCSFCNKALEEVAWLVTPPATKEVTICDECLAFAVTLLDNSRTGKRNGRGTYPR